MEKQEKQLNGNINYTPRQTNKWFNAQLWHNGEKYLMVVQVGALLKGKLQMLNELFYKINIQVMFMMKLV